MSYTGGNHNSDNTKVTHLLRENNNAPPGGEETTEQAGHNAPDYGLMCLVMAARVLGLPADYHQLARAYPPSEYSNLRLLRAAKGLGLKAKKTAGGIDRLDGMPLPALVFMNDGSMQLLIKSSPEKLLVYDPGTIEDGTPQRASIVEAEKFKERWSGEAILITRRFSFAAMGEKFGIT